MSDFAEEKIRPIECLTETILCWFMPKQKRGWDMQAWRHSYGEPIASRQAIAFMIAENAIEIDATRLLTWYAAWKMDRGEDATKDAYLAKRYASDMVIKV